MSETETTENSRVEPSTAAAPGGAAPVFSWAPLLVLMAATFINVLDYFISNVAIPSIQSGLAADNGQTQGVIVGYGVAFTSGMIFAGRLGDLYGRRKLFAVGMTVFVVASAACGLAPTATFLVVARIVQGAGSALMVPQVLALLSNQYSGAARAKAFTVYGLVIGVAASMGQFVGGVLITVNLWGLDWRLIFLINIPIGILALAFLGRTVPESRNPNAGGLDVFGALLVAAGLAVLNYSIVVGGQDGWPVWSLVAVPGGVVIVGLAVAHLRRRRARGRQPLIDLALFASRRFSWGLVATVSYFLAMGSFFFLLALHLQQGRGLNPLQSGLVFLAVGGGFLVMSFVNDRLTATLGNRLPVVGTTVLAVAYALISGLTYGFGTGLPLPWLVLLLLMAGIGMGMTTGPLTGITLAGADPDHAASASGATNTAQEGGAAIGVAIAGAVYYPLLSGQATQATAFAATLLPLIAFCVVASFLCGRAAVQSAAG